MAGMLCISGHFHSRAIPGSKAGNLWQSIPAIPSNDTHWRCQRSEAMHFSDQGLSLALALALFAVGQHPETQGVKLDESFGILLVVYFFFLERADFLIVDAVF